MHELNLAIRALAEHQLNHTAESERALAELSPIMSQTSTSSTRVSHDFLIAEILFDEARAKIRKP